MFTLCVRLYVLCIYEIINIHLLYIHIIEDASSSVCFLQTRIWKKRRCHIKKLHGGNTECHVHPFTAFCSVIMRGGRESLWFLVALLCRGRQLGNAAVQLGNMHLVWLVRSCSVAERHVCVCVCVLVIIVFVEWDCLCGNASSNGSIVRPASDRWNVER
jgi:hypothetical protein